MIANYHTHTWRCNHASGTEVDYIEHALRNGLKILGFSDHSPYIFPEGYYSHFRMGPQQLPGYVRTLTQLREQYQDQLKIFIGLETEYYPKYFPDLMAYLREYPLEYMILGQHYLGNEIHDFYSGEKTDDESLLTRYCYQCMEAMNTGVFTYLAHPDLFHFVGNKKFYQDAMRSLCREANSCQMPLELNLLGMAEKRHYPNPKFWEIAAEENCHVILGRDAHDPRAFDNEKAEKKALKMVKKLGLELLDAIPLRPIG